MTASLSSRHLVLPISFAIAALLAIVVVSYRQGIRAYASSGGSYVFAKENLGTLPALVAAAALLTDYVLTVAVSVAAGIFAITSAAPSLASHRVILALACIVILTLGNLRGVREAGLLFAFPTYGFVVCLYAALAVGIGRCATGSCPQAHVPHPLAAGAGTLGLFVLLKAFASGSAALTGVESISNGVTAFRHPQAKNAARTLAVMAAIAITLFIGVSYLAVKMDARPSGTASVLSQIASAAFGSGSAGTTAYYLVQAFTFAILILAANTSYQGFPRLSALLAHDSFIPRQFLNLGDRLVYSNGIIVLSALAAGLIVAFQANVNSLIHLYVIGVFTAFTLAQAGMVRHWQRVRDPGWRGRATLNAVGAATTAVVTAVVIATKFADGAWMVIIAIPILVASFYAVHRHYRSVGRRLTAKARAVLARPEPTNTVIVYVERLDAATREALWYARTISQGPCGRSTCPFPGSDSGHRPALLPLDRRQPAARDPAFGRRPARRRARGDLGDPTGREPVRDRRRPGALSQAVAACRRSCAARRSRSSSGCCASRAWRHRRPEARRGRRPTAASRGASSRSRASTPPRCARCCMRARSGSARRRAVYFAEDDDEVGAIERRLAALPDRPPARDRRSAVPRRRHAPADVSARHHGRPETPSPWSSCPSSSCAGPTACCTTSGRST